MYYSFLSDSEKHTIALWKSIKWNPKPMSHFLKITKTFIGHPEPKWCIWFCNEFVGYGDTYKDAVILRKKMWDNG